VREVAARTPLVRIAQGDEPGRKLSVAVDARPNSFDGQLEVEGKSGTTMVRTISGQSCAAVVSALALVAAVSIDPNASTAPLPPEQPPPPANPPPRDVPPPVRTPPRPRAPAPATQPPGRAAGNVILQRSLGLDGLVLLGPTPTPAWGVSL